jgi:hypothetical protein
MSCDFLMFPMLHFFGHQFNGTLCPDDSAHPKEVAYKCLLQHDLVQVNFGISPLAKSLAS